MADNITLSTDTLVDVSGLNKAYEVNKKRIDNLVSQTGETFSKNSDYARRIGDTNNHDSIGSTFNPVYVNDSGEIRPIVESIEEGGYDMSLGNENANNIYLGGENNSTTVTHSNSFKSKSFNINDKVTLRYDDILGALVFDFS